MKKLLSAVLLFTLMLTVSCNAKTTPASAGSAAAGSSQGQGTFAAVEVGKGPGAESAAGTGAKTGPEVSETAAGPGAAAANARQGFILPEGTTLETRFAVPEGYVRTPYSEESFGSFVRNYSLKPDGSPVLLWTKVPKGNQWDHAAVFDMFVEDELDVQQCADSVMRIYAEYFRATGQYDRIRFHFVSGFLCDYNTYMQGNRVRVDGSSVTWVQSKAPEDSDRVFNEYLKIVYAYASTLSMEGESAETGIQDLQIGDVFLYGGSPGHVAMVADVCEKDGKKAFLLAQGYMPAQEFHIIKNPRHADDPWYYEEEVQYPFETQAYTFPEGSLRRMQY